MPLTPDQPFPKKQGDNIRSKDWNDAVTELIRLDTAKLTLATGGQITGPLSVSGNLGVGTTAPAGKLSIEVPYNGSPAVVLRQATASWSSVAYYNDFRYIRTEFAGGASDGPFRQFNVGAGGVSIGYGNVPTYGSGSALFVNGAVGIGTTAPDRPLTIQGAGGTYLNLKGSDGAQEVLVGADGAGGIVSTMTNHDLQLRAGGNETKVTIKAGGNVGIGTTDPSAARLVIAGVSSWNSGLRLTGSSANGIGLSLENTTAGGHRYALLSGGASNGPGNLTGAFGLYDDTMGAYRLVVDAAGNVGIKTGSPSKELHVNGGLRVESEVSVGGGYAFDIDAPGVVGGRLRVLTNGNVGIGTNNPTRARLQVNGSMGNTTGAYGYINRNGAGNTTATQFGIPYSVWADERMAAPEFNAFSDERIKDIRGRSDGAADLQTLLAIEVTDYRYRDVIVKGDGPHKKLIAQQVERVFPQAVSTQNEVVPDIYRRASLADGWVKLVTDLKEGERVRLIADKAEGVYEVLEVGPDRFRTDFRPEGGEVFVYGREVDDFRVLDYDAVAMLNVSATQQLKREKDEEVRALRAECAELRAANDALAGRLRLLEGGPEIAPSFAGGGSNGNGSNGNGRH